jgi:hypothetical protein
LIPKINSLPKQMYKTIPARDPKEEEEKQEQEEKYK